MLDSAIKARKIGPVIRERTLRPAMVNSRVPVEKSLMDEIPPSSTIRTVSTPSSCTMFLKQSNDRTTRHPIFVKSSRTSDLSFARNTTTVGTRLKIRRA